MTSLPHGMSACHCCTNRRRFLAAGCSLCAATVAPASLAHLALASDKAAANRPRVRLVFACWAITQDRPTWPHIGYPFAPVIEKVTSTLRQLCPQVEILPVAAHSPEDAQKITAADKAENIDGYVVYQLNNWVRVMQDIIATGKPTLIADFLYAGSGGFLVYGSTLRRKHHNFAVVSSAKLDDLAEAVKCFALLKQGKTTADFVAACDRLRRQRTAAPSGTACKDDALQLAGIGECLAATKRAKLVVVGKPMQNAAAKLHDLLGITFIPIDYPELAAAGAAANADKVHELAAGWKAGAKSVALDDVAGTLETSARNYLGQQAILEKYRAEGITINCLGGFYSGHMKAYPCLGFVELLNAGYVGACEADLLSSATMLALKHLANRPGFISDPVLDTSTRQVIYAHCVATTKPLGPASAANSYEILTHSEDRRGAAVRSFLPTGYMTTSIRIHPDRGELLCHRAKAVDNIVVDRACRTKLAAEVVGDFEKMFTFWDQYGWHRTTFYGDLWEPAKELAAALKLKFVQEA